MIFDWCFKCDTKHDLDEPCEGKMSVSVTGIIGYSSVPDSNGDTGVYVIPQMGKAAQLMSQALQILADIENS